MAGATWLILSMGLMAAAAEVTQLITLSLPLGGALSLENGPFYTDEFIRQNQVQYNNTLLEYETMLANCRANYQQRTKDLDSQTRLLGLGVLQVEAKLNPLEVLSDSSRSCVQEYRGQFNNWITVKASLDACILTANNGLNNVLWQPENTKRTLSNYYSGQMKNGLNACIKQNPDLQLNYTICVQSVIDAANTYTMANRRTFFTQMRSSQCSIDNTISIAMECVSTTNYMAAFTMGDAMRSIEDCVSGAHKCASCPQDDCAQLTINPSLDVTIPNPFYNIGAGVTCARVTFEAPAAGGDIVNAAVNGVAAVNAAVPLQDGVGVRAGLGLTNGATVNAGVSLRDGVRVNAELPLNFDAALRSGVRIV